MEDSSKENEIKRHREWLMSLPKIQRVFLILLTRLGVEGDALAGTFLLMKDDVESMEEMILWLYDFHPSREEIQAELVRRVKERQKATS